MVHWKDVTEVDLRELAARAQQAYAAQLEAFPKPDWWQLRLEEGVLPEERAYWRAKGWYRCQCGTVRRSWEARRVKLDGGWVYVCGVCERMCLTLWRPIDPPASGWAVAA